MTVAALVTEGIGSYGDVAHVITDGLGIGAASSTNVIATILTEGFGMTATASAFVVTEGFCSSSTPTPTPTPTPGPVVVPSAGGSYGIQDNYWREVERRYEKKKKQAKKKSKKAVEIVEDLARQELVLSEAISMLREELAAANVKNQEIYVELLKLKLEIVEEEESDDAWLLLH